jgi:hypothetical protein
MAGEVSLTSGQFAALREVAEAGLQHGTAISFVHLGLLLRLNYIRAESDGYAPTASGIFRIASGL